MRSLSPPIRFVVCILALWTGLRLATFAPLYPEQQGRGLTAAIAESSGPADIVGAPIPRAHGSVRASLAPIRARRRAEPISTRFARALAGRTEFGTDSAGAAARVPPGGPGMRVTPGTATPALALGPESRSPSRPLGGPALPAGDSRWSLTGWSLWRPDTGPPSLASGGQLGGSQAGLRLGYRLLGDRSLALNLRLSRPLRGPDGAEAAVGLAIRPSAALPVEILAERRIALEDGGRDAWALGIAGGVDPISLPHDFELGGWAQAGVVGARSRDLYVEGALVLRRELLRLGRAELAVGAGGWAAAQPGAGRVDLGPEASLWFPVGDGAMRLGASWRQRVAGDAAPDSGPAVTLTTDF